MFSFHQASNVAVPFSPTLEENVLDAFMDFVFPFIRGTAKLMQQTMSHVNSELEI